MRAVSSLCLALVCLSACGLDGASGRDGRNGRDGVDGLDGGGGADGTDGTHGVDGTNGASAVVRTSVLPVGDASCPHGGTRIDFGVDNGADGGVAGDGVLQDGERQASTFDCNPPSDDFGLEPPTAPAGAYTMSADAGAGYIAGAGGSVRFTKDTVTFGAVKLFGTGAVQPVTTVAPVPAGPADGTIVASVITDTHVQIDPADPDSLADGTLYIVGDSLRMRAGGAEVTPTHLYVAEGATLELGDTASVYASFRNLAEIYIAGGLTTVIYGSGVSHKPLYIAAKRVVLTPSSLIAMDGEVVLGGVGGNGGQIMIDADELIADGTVRANGGDGNDGGVGGRLTLNGKFVATNRGAVELDGGDGAVQNGGNGGSYGIGTLYGRVVLGGTLSLDGGPGGVNGGIGGQVIVVSTAGSVDSSKQISADGGDALAGCATACIGGAGGAVLISPSGGSVRHNAPMSARGGGAPVGDAGAGGTIVLATTTSTLPGDIPAGSVFVSGNLNASGGACASGRGGNGGTITLNLGTFASSREYPAGQEIVAAGYTAIHARGGAGTASGGAGGLFQVLTSRGGSRADAPFVSYTAIDASGGVAESIGGAGGVISAVVRGAFENHGTIVARGGDGQGALGVGGAATTFTIDAPMDSVRNSGSMDCSGGASVNGPNVGGNAGAIRIRSVTGENTGTVLLRGGDASTARGGAGGVFEAATQTLSYSNTGTIEVTGGLGTPAGPLGSISTY